MGKRIEKVKNFVRQHRREIMVGTIIVGTMVISTIIGNKIEKELEGFDYRILDLEDDGLDEFVTDDGRPIFADNTGLVIYRDAIAPGCEGNFTEDLGYTIVDREV